MKNKVASVYGRDQLMKSKLISASGFTLLEILIALFIFTLVSMMLMSALHHIINIQSGTEQNAERLRNLQLTLLKVSRDVEQIVNRPILNTAGKEEYAFIGTVREFEFTHIRVAH